MARKELLILERSGANLSATTSEDGAVVLEGVFTEIGVKNKNNRIYEEAEVLPHIQELQNKVTTSKLLGELDHPKNFDISLGNVSHVIEKLEYDKDKKQVLGRVRILNTDKGKQAKALIEDGIPLHISSRAAGTVNENGKVSIKKLFTYDLVADPGFENAELRRVNESYGFNSDDNLFIYEISESSTEDDKYNKVTKQNNDTLKMENTNVSAEDFDKYSEYVKGEILSLKEKLGKSTTDSEKVENLIEYTNGISEGFNKLQRYVDYLAENLDRSISHTDHVVEGFNSMEKYMNYVVENVNDRMSYVDYIAEKLDQSIAYAQYIAENADKGIEYAKYLSEKLDQNITYSEYVAENTDKVIAFTNYLAEGLNEQVLSREKLNETVTNLIAYSEYIKENVENVGKYSDYLAESINRLVESGASVKFNAADVVNEEKPETAPVQTEVPESIEESYRDKVASSIEALVESARAKMEAEDNKDLHFMRFLSEAKRNEFNEFGEETQQKIVESFKMNRYFSTNDVERIWESNFNSRPESLDYITNMPEKFRKQWENLSEARQSQIKSQSKHYPLNTQYQIDNFWQTRDLRASQVVLEAINENATAAQDAPKSSVNQDYLESIREQVARKMGRA